tara:strand:+ start:4577 stop:5047 length:471 start_codon:yes stop_codon:yes gene_type:complete
MSKTALTKLIKTELAIVQVTTDSKKFLNKYEALIHEVGLEEKRNENRSWENMKQELVNIVLEVLKKNRWGIYFQNEPMQSLPMKDSLSTLYKVNQVELDEFEEAVKMQFDKESERNEQCQENQAKDLQTDKGLSDGTKTISKDTEGWLEKRPNTEQ